MPSGSSGIPPTPAFFHHEATDHARPAKPGHHKGGASMTRSSNWLKRREFLKAAGAVAAVGPFIRTRPARADKELVVGSWGGPWNEALRNVMCKDVEAQTGIHVRDDAPPENAKIKAMVDSGNVTWDVIDTDMPAILTLVKDDLLIPLDYSKLDSARLANI